MSGSSPAGKGQGYVFWKRNGIENAWILAASGGERLKDTPTHEWNPKVYKFLP